MPMPGSRQLMFRGRSMPCAGGNWLVIMVKAPVLGRVKTRLAADVGGVAAVGFYRSTAAAVVARLAADTRWRTVLAVAPDPAVQTPMFDPAVTRVAQGSGDLGDRLTTVARGLPPGRTVIIGTDIPGVQRADIADAFSELGRHDGVLGPAPDGGYWLVGLRRSPRITTPFAPVRWSSEHARADTKRNFTAGQTIGSLRMLADVDDGQTYAAVAAWSGRRVLPASDGEDPAHLR